MIQTPEKLDVRLQSSILSVGQALCSAAGSTRRVSPRPREQPNLDLIEESVGKVLRAVRLSPARKFIGIKRSVEEKGDIARLKAVAAVAWQMIGETTASTHVEEIAGAISSPKGEPTEELLLARDLLGRMVGEGLLTLDISKGDQWSGRLALTQSAYIWMCGGSQSRGHFDPRKLDLSRLRRGVDWSDGEETAEGLPKTPTAREIYDKVIARVVGLNDQVRVMASRMCLHSLRCETPRTADDPVGTQVIVLAGESGSGKTYLAESVAAACGFPSVTFDATTLTSEGYVGGKVDDIFKMIVANCKGDVKAAMKGSLAILDEADKLDLRSRREISSSAVQAELLRPIQGADVLIGGKRQSDCRPYLFGTRNVAFCLAGCFPDLNRIIERRSGRRSIGFTSQAGDRQHPFLLDALREYYLDELCNRISCVLVLPSPTERDLQIATAEDIQAGFANLLLRRGIVIHLDGNAIWAIACYGLDSKTYYRGCKQVLASISEELLFDAKPNAYLIGERDVRRAIARLSSGIVQTDDGYSERPEKESVWEFADADADPVAEPSGVVGG
jgi:ATP-dependent Clp protease ATP-binding subunit ClpX